MVAPEKQLLRDCRQNVSLTLVDGIVMVLAVELDEAIVVRTDWPPANEIFPF